MFLVTINDKEFSDKIHADSVSWRHKRLLELIEKEKMGNLEEIERYLIKKLSEMHGADF